MLKKIVKQFVFPLLMGICASAFGYSSVIEGGSTETVTNLWEVPLTWLVVGGNSESNTLIITDSGTVVSSNTRIGNNLTSTDNSALVTGDGSEWNNAAELSVGVMGADNSLTVADGGTLVTTHAYIGKKSDNNQIVITGTNSLMDTDGLGVGYEGSGNSLLVTDGGTVESDFSTNGIWVRSYNNTTTVQSNGSWNSTFEITIGEHGSSNQLVVGAGGYVESPIVNVGVQSTSSNNTISVTGEGAWLDAPELYIGGSADGAGGTGNLVEVENGGTVYTESLNIYSDNAFDLNDGGRLFVNTDFNASTDNFNWNSGGTLEVGGELTGMTNSIENQRSLVLNGPVAHWDMSAEDIKVGDITGSNTLSMVNGALVENQNGYIGYGTGADSNSVSVSGGDALWRNYDGLYLGGHYEGTNWVDGGTGNSLAVSDQARVLIGDADTSSARFYETSGGVVVGSTSNTVEMIVANGAFVENERTYIGLGEDESGSVTVTGSSSFWESSRSMIVGLYGASNSLTIENGGRVETSIGALGYESGSANNSVLVTGSNAVWECSKRLDIGLRGYATNNILIIENGGRVETKNANIGWGQFADDNSVVVNGDGSVLDISRYLHVGNLGANNSLTIENGGQVRNDYGYIGYESDNNNVRVTGINSVWKNSRDLHVGESGSGNSMIIENAGSVYANGGYIGWESDSENNSVRVTGDDSAWYCSRELAVGQWGGGNSLIIENGGYVRSPDGHIGFSSDNNSVLVTGDGSAWDAPSYLFIGGSGSGNSLTIENGGRVDSGSGDIGIGGFGGSNNSVLVSGSGSVWNNTGYLRLGSGSSDNSLIIENGGQVRNTYAYVGDDYTDSNSVLVSGNNSVWSNSADLFIGRKAAYNTMTVEEGGRVENQMGYIGYGTGFSSAADSNAVMVTGAGSVWTNSGDVYVGYDGSYNALNVASGGTVYNESGYIGYGSDSNSTTVSGNWSTWINDGELHVGYNGSDNALHVADEGHVYAWDGMTIGHGASATSNRVTVSGNGSFLNSGAPLLLARFRVYTNYPPPPPYGWNFPTNSYGGGSVITHQFFGGTNLPPLFGAEGSLHVVTNNLINANGGGQLFIDSGNSLTMYNGFLAEETADPVTDGLIDYGDTSVWEPSTNLIVGSVGSSNTLVIVPGTFPFLRPLLSVDDLYGQLVVGHGGSYNSLDIEAGGLTASGTGIIGATSNSWFNSVSVSGDNSRWMLFGNLYIGGRLESGTWNDGGLGNALYVADGGLVDIAFDLHNRNYSIVNMDPGGLVSVGGDYYQDDTAMLRFGVETNAAGAPVNALMTVGGTAEFEEGAQIEYASNVGELLFDRFYTNKLIEADALVVAGITNANSLDLERLDASGSLVDVIFWEHEQDIYALAGRKYLTESAGFDPDSMMGRLAKEIDDMSLLGRSGAMGMIDLLNTMTGAEQYQQLLQEYAYSAPSYLHAQGMTEGLGELAKHTSRYQAAAPEGANGPHRTDQGLRGWIRPYGTWSERSEHDGFSGYDHNVYGTIVGMDWIQSGVLLGVAGGYARSDIEQDNGDASDAETGYGVFYASVGTNHWFGDINVAVGRSDIEDQSGTEFGSNAGYKASNFALFLGGGREFRSRTGLFSFTPKASLLLSDYQQNAYSEEVEPGVVRDVAAYGRSSILSSLGAAVAMQKEYERTLFRPEVRLRWLHEFNSDVEQIDFVFSQGVGGEYFSLMPAPEEDVLEAGAGLTWTMNDRLSLVLDVDWRIGEDYDAYAVSGRAAVEF